MKSTARLIQQSEVFSQNQTGVVFYDITEQKTVFEQEANRFFMPASNTKLFTFYASLKTLGDSIPAFHYQVTGDSLIVWGTGDPSFLHPDLAKSKVYDFLKSRPEKIYFSNDNFTGLFFGQGWAWDDYNDDYAAEISGFPIHGNVVRFKANGQNALNVSPKFFENKVYDWSNTNSFSMQRDLGANLFSHPSLQKMKPTFEQDVPFKTGLDITVALLSDTLKKEVTLINKALDKSAKTFYSLPADSLYKRMLHVSDNMIAEHLMVLNADALVGELNVSKGIDAVKKKFMTDLPDASRWVDGSGLSRYNLFTPRSIVKLLQNIYLIVPQERLFQLLPAAGKSGTLKSLSSTEKPFIFAKSGSFSNNYNLSGYLVTKKGKVLIFSIMNNSFMKPMSEIRKEVSKILTEVHEKN
ncbi:MULTISPECIES: D-alanyl-D-alanine carboxypeptidase/D-alanyl-D-alanine-endopeptidase [unclassified Arcicella]|uniref:D-alanyl-D-alanine carboxypeptidase/D-alanyl-D-alanine endopeptidase n=1 Tax=unclassified Arcicella TaxID=2644986 RepID=UPI0028657257|nr:MULTISPECIES: D-alanyl-D-alanine carboxypeptidase/D-alanyl-D-alanine-endopeptidase [unclassified Arcicella]MDR6563686.1 D-alanyl-D-alanine carboxypeptidase/D-alanyl-D-alanine-endopeptidase (penicillin-binding protein 4) [Arcicella sp. BE51]MDR6814176.1 D-alanyl-D-alanine carboxypeptidase/D-alanyl-D-alanine-endopeptidase (penicillin-binding protein 4) [Arcicella sp. BE140]MDR6825585.1 D-alanyl-D-alanine carboxypeptidase/D-alanyl-D-alanine-endopeptidase (penicillin-binding protein 4) [Arcicella